MWFLLFHWCCVVQSRGNVFSADRLKWAPAVWGVYCIYSPCSFSALTSHFLPGCCHQSPCPCWSWWKFCIWHFQSQGSVHTGADKEAVKGLKPCNSILKAVQREIMPGVGTNMTLTFKHALDLRKWTYTTEGFLKWHSITGLYLY